MASTGNGTMDFSKLPNKVDQANALVTISAVFTGISTFFVIVRTIIRSGIIRKTGIDDILIIISTVCFLTWEGSWATLTYTWIWQLFTIAYLAVIVLARDTGLGQRIFTLSLGQMETLLKHTYAIEILYYVIIVTTKSSIVAMYYNIALTMSFRRACQITHAFLCVFFIVCIAVTFGQCRPLSLQWDPTLAPAARRASCIDTTAFFYFTSAFNIIMDFWILGMPLRTLQTLQIRRSHRWVLYGVFGAFAFATAMSCVRLYSIYTYTLAEDPFMEGSLINVWSMIEINVGIICASVPALKPLFTPKLLLARARGENPDAASAPPIHSGGSSSSNNSEGRYQKMKKAHVQYHADEGSDIDLTTTTAPREGATDHKQPWTSTSEAEVRVSPSTSQKNLVGEDGSSRSSSCDGLEENHNGLTKVPAARTKAVGEDNKNTFELQQQSSRRA
ncbi:hypothetical protein PG990_003311 [Apiospora arundinis]